MVLGRAGGGGGDGGILEKLTKLFVILMKMTKFLDNDVFSLNSWNFAKMPTSWPFWPFGGPGHGNTKDPRQGNTKDPRQGNSVPEPWALTPKPYALSLSLEP